MADTKEEKERGVVGGGGVLCEVWKETTGCHYPSKHSV